MGSSSSKAVRKLPTSASAASRPAPAWAGARTPHPNQAQTPPTPGEQSTRSSGFDYGQSNTGASGSSAAARGSRSTSTPVWHDNSRAGQDVGSSSRGGQPGFSGEKDDAVRRDAMDPQFASNLSRLGQVKIEDAGRFFRPPAPAQRTLTARQANSDPLTPQPNTLSPTHLISLLDRLKTLPAGSNSKDVEKLYREYGIDAETMTVLRRWVNSPSVGEDDDVRVVEGEEIREMKAVWVDGGRGEQGRLGAPGR